MTWRAARSLLTLQKQLQAGAPRARPPATDPDAWGLVADAAHDPTSDHAPKNFPGWGSEIVTAEDFPNAPALGLDAHAVLNDIRLSRDPRVKYGISNGQIFSSYATSSRAAWAWGPYSGSDDMHYTHGHLSVVGDARADDPRPWHTIGAPEAPGEDEDMGQSFAGQPIERGPKATSIVIPPVQAGTFDPREVVLRVGGDIGNDKVALRIWGCNDGGTWGPLGGGGTSAGLHRLANGRPAVVALPAGVTTLSIRRMAINAAGEIVEPSTDGAEPLSDASLSAAFERK